MATLTDTGGSTGAPGFEAIVLAGGLGTRISSVVADRPKVMAQVGGRPFVEFLLGRMARDPDETFEGEVVGLAGAGAFVAFGPRAEFEGMVPVRRLRGDWWELNEQSTILVGTRSGAAIRLGDSIRIRVGGIDAPRGRVDLLPGWED